MRQRDGIIAYDVTSGVHFVPGYFVWKSTGIAHAFGHTHVAPELNYLF